MDDPVRIVFNERGQWLLPRRFKAGTDPEKDRLWTAAERLVLEGVARWISPASTLWPGIELTGRGWQSPFGQQAKENAAGE